MTTLAARLAFIEPMVPSLVDSPPDGDGWLHELKYDGYRTQFVIEGDHVRAFSRRGHDWSRRYRSLIDDLRDLDCESAIIDGEVIVQAASGLSDYHALRAELARKNPRGLVLMAFDLLHVDGRDLRSAPVEERRARLQELLGANEASRSVHFSDHIVGGGADFFAAAEAMGMEGIVSKRLGSRYRSGQAKSWLKTKAFTESEFVVIGTSKGDLAPVALLARETEDHRLEYAGAAMVTFAESDRELFWRANERLKTERPALHMEPRPETSWLKPEMRVRVRHLRGEEMLRHATVKAISHLPAAPRPAAPAPAKPPRSEPTYEVPEGLPDREALLGYYREVAPLMLPFLANRPLNLFRCHHGRCFFQRNENHPPSHGAFDHPAIRKIPVQQKNGKVENYFYVEAEAGIIACVEAQTVEFHAWGSRVPDIEKPDRIAFDLDPGEGVGFEAVKDAAFQLRASLQAIGLESWPLLTGGKGLHVVVPFEQEGEWDEVREFARSFCAALADANPDRFTVALPKAQRKGRIFLDYLRNQRTSTAIMPYSLRARTGAPVAAPLAWAELASIARAGRFGIGEARDLFRRASSRELAGWGEALQSLPRI